MASTTTVHVLRLKLGRVLRLEITETDDAVYIHWSGDKPRPSDRKAVFAFMGPLVVKYENDNRPIELDSVHNTGPAARLLTLARNDDSVVLGITEVPRPGMQA